jgi:hypothetical protein
MQMNRSSAVLLVVLASCAGGSGPQADPSPQGVSVQVRPEAPSVITSAAIQFLATVTGTTVDTGVSWSVTELDGGTIGSDGYYTAPASTGTFHVVARANADTTKSASAIVTVSPAASKVRVGVNLAWIEYWDPTLVFANAAKHANFWEVAGGGAAAATDADYWPTQDARLGLGTHPGTHKLSFTGQATLGGNSVSFANKAYDPVANRTTADVTLGSSNAWINFTSTKRLPGDSAGDGITNVKLMRPGLPEDVGTADTRFNPDFLKAIASSGFTAIRYYHALAPSTMETVNGVPSTVNGDVNWSDRARPYMVGKRRMTWEDVILLSNKTGTDPWITIPFYVTDDYLTKLAQTFKYGSDGTNPYTSPQASPVFPPLAPGRNLYVEYSNELWNSGSGYPDTGVNTAQGAQEIAPEWNSLGWTHTLSGSGYTAGAHVAYTTGSTQMQSYVYRTATGHVYRCTNTAGLSSTPPESDPTHWADVGARATFDPKHLTFDNTLNGFWWRRVAWLGFRHSLIFRQVFGDADMPLTGTGRIRPVLAGQHGYYGQTNDHFAYVTQVLGAGSAFSSVGGYPNPKQPVGYYFYGYATAPYIMYASSASTPATLDAAFASLNDNLSGAGSYGTNVEQAIDYVDGKCAAAGIKMLAYEGGQSIFDGQPFEVEAQADPRMNTLTLDLLHYFYSKPTAEHFNYYCLISGGAQFALNPASFADQTTQKWLAVKQVIAGQ